MAPTSAVSRADRPPVPRPIHFTAGALAALTGNFVVQPLELFKTRIQSSHAHSLCLVGSCGRVQTGHVSLLSSITSIVRNQGVRSLYRGFLPTAMGIAPSYAIYFSVYSPLRTHLLQHVEEQVATVSAAVTGSVIMLTATSPFWYLKTRLQIEHNRRSLTQCVRDTHRTYGLRGFFCGMQASYIGVGEFAIQFLLYERMKILLFQVEEASKLHFAVAGALSKAVAAALAYPHQVVRTRLRQRSPKYKRLVPTFQTILREEGVRALYRGLTIQLALQMPCVAVTMTIYEMLVEFYWNSQQKT